MARNRAWHGSVGEPGPGPDSNDRTIVVLENQVPSKGALYN